ncbi:Pyruvate kinase [Fasciola hepatica]|uniref:Pyruvate kinase n=1 Tax=Fasciola hepatica TaxID=6192 RepID=A0A4E0RDF9_FASHE|nr:Pyruvate kinase [Fasciola hepatica]
MDVLLRSSVLKVPPKLASRSRGTDIYLHQFQEQQHGLHARTHLEHVSQLDIDSSSAYVRQTTIVCTLGELWNSDEQIKVMIRGGMNILRMNLSMGTHEYFADAIRRVRAIEKSSGHNPPVGIALDISAPPVRTGLVNNNLEASIILKDGQSVQLTTNERYRDQTTEDVIWVDSQYYPTVLQRLAPGDRFYLDDGMLSLIVQTVGCDTVECLVERGGELGSWKRVELPSERLYPADFETTYKTDLAYASECKVDYVFTGYASTPNKLLYAKDILGPEIKLFAKVENREAMRNLDQLMSVADGIIIGRGGLGLRYPPEKIFQIQKQLIVKCNILGKPVFVITQLLESMRFKPRATRAEISDVANAVIDGADGLILTVETSRGLYPRETLRVLHMTCREAESAIYHGKFCYDLKFSRDLRGLSPMEPVYFTALAAVEASNACNASAIVVTTTTGHSATAIASFRPSCPVIAVVRSPEVARHCHSFRGIHPFVCMGKELTDWSDDMDASLNKAIEFGCSRWFIAGGDNVVIVSGWEAGADATNTVRVFEVPTGGIPINIVNSHASSSGKELND